MRKRLTFTSSEVPHFELVLTYRQMFWFVYLYRNVFYANTENTSFLEMQTETTRRNLLSNDLKGTHMIKMPEKTINTISIGRRWE